MNSIVEFHTDRRLMVPLDTIRQHPRNPNNGDIESIAESILANGFYGAMVVQQSTGFILAGNHRYAALLSLGVQDGPVLYADVDDEEALRILIADNRTAELAVRNERELLDLLKSLEDTQPGLAGTGYDEKDLAEMNRVLNAVEHMPLDVDPEPDIEEYTPHVTVRGYLEDDGGIRKFDGGEVMDVVSRLRDLGYHATGGVA